MSSILQPSDNDYATLYAIAWDIVKREVATSDTRFTSSEIAAMVAGTFSRIVVDGGHRIAPPAQKQKP